jgi:hypothetical protein
MMKTSLLILVALTSSVSYAGGQAGSVGVGAEYQLSGLGGVSANYDAGKFHIGGFFGYGRFGNNTGVNPEGTYVDFGARAFFHLHSTAMSDFGIGGGLGFQSRPPLPMMGRQTYMFLEPGVQIRLFLASNVALSFTAGFSFGLVDAPDRTIVGGGAVGGNVAIGNNVIGAPTAAAGVHYYFF